MSRGTTQDERHLLTHIRSIQGAAVPLFAEILKQHFPWLETDEDANGADVVDQLAELYERLKSTPKIPPKR